MSWNPDSGYAGSLLDLLEDLFAGYYPDLKKASDTQDWLINQLNLEVGPFVYRHSSDIRNMVNRPGRNKPRYYFSTDFQDIPFDIIASDNEANSSLFSSLLGPNPVNYKQLTILEALQGPIKVGILRNDSCELVERDAFSQKSIQTTMNNHVHRPALSNLQLDHIIDAGQNMNLPFGADQLKQRCFRLLTPLNVFPFPSQKEYDHQMQSAPAPSGIGGTPEGQTAFQYFLFQKYFDAGFQNTLSEYYKQFGQAMPDINRVRRQVAQLANVRIEIHPNQGPRIPHASQTTPQVVQEPGGQSIFEIKETTSGRFHLNGFGVTFGGPNRNIPVTFVVIDSTGKILLRSKPTTAKDLGIAARLRGDYDADKFRSSDIVVRDSAGNIVPGNALGRRIPWL